MSDFTPNTYRADLENMYMHNMLTSVGHLIRDRLSLSEENPSDMSNMSIACM